jgi:NADH dehydrogenase
MIRRVNFFCGDADKIDIESKQAVVSHDFNRHSHTLEYGRLVLALGSVTNFFNLPGVAERALTMKSLGDANFRIPAKATIASQHEQNC